MNMLFGFLLSAIVSFYSIRKEVRRNKAKKAEYNEKLAKLKSIQNEVENIEKSVTL